MKSPTVTYFEHYPHYMGTSNSKATMRIEDLVLLSLLARDDMDIFQEFCDHLAAENDNSLYAIEDLFDMYSLRQITNALIKKGYFIGEWEEGSFFVAFKGNERKAKIELALHEARISSESGEYD